MSPTRTRSRTPKISKPKPAAPMKQKTRKRTARAKPVIEIDLDSEPVIPSLSPSNAKRSQAANSPAKPMSGLDAAAKVLQEAGEPLAAQVLVARMLERGLWKTAGKTPAATIYAGIIREITAKGPSSRFQKVDRGRFAAAG